MSFKRKKKKSPYFWIIISFVCVIIAGTLLLALPFSTTKEGGLTILEAFFTTVSSVCVTGLSVVSNTGESFTFFGKLVIMILIEIGGLSFLTLTIFFLSAFKVKLGISETFLMREQLGQNTLKNLESLTMKIVRLTLSIQAIGAIITTFIIYFSHDSGLSFSFWDSLEIGIFHAVSSFNNAGFDIFGTPNSMIPYASNIALNIVTMILIILGGLGFVVIIDIGKNRSFKKLTLHSKITLVTTTTLVVFGAIAIKCSMWNNMTLLEAFFLSVTSRTCGFTSYDLSKMSETCYCIVIILMFIGASSGSCGGGVKTSTVFVVITFIIYYIKGKTPKAFYRRISNKVLIKALALINFTLIFDVIMTMLICAFETNNPDITFKEILFEQVSAFSTTGLTMGITSSLTTASKIALCVSMFVGRVGPLTFMGVMNKQWLYESEEKIKYVEENVMIG